MRNPVEELATMRTTFELVREPVFVVEAVSGCIVDVNPAACDALVIARNGLIGRPWKCLVGRLGETTLCDVDGRLFVAIAHPPRAEWAKRSSIPRDALTGLATREALLAHSASDAASKPLSPLALLFIDLDGFKQVNDTCGHVAGDRVLRVVAQRLSNSVRPGDLVVRYGGDEFLVVVEAISRRRDLDRLAGRIGRALRRPILLQDHEVVLSASIGIAQRKAVAATIDALIAEADRAMYRAKRQNCTDGTSNTPTRLDSYVRR